MRRRRSQCGQAAHHSDARSRFREPGAVSAAGYRLRSTRLITLLARYFRLIPADDAAFTQRAASIYFLLLCYQPISERHWLTDFVTS